MTQVHPVTAKNDKQEKLREEASLGEGEEVFADTDAGTQRSEFEHLLDFLDTDSNGKVWRTVVVLNNKRVHVCSKAGSNSKASSSSNHGYHSSNAASNIIYTPLRS